MRWIPGSSLTPIGLDVGTRQIKAAQLSRSQGRARIEAISVIPRMKPDQPIDVEEIQYLRSVLNRQGFRGKDIVLKVPHERLLRGILEVPTKGSGAPRSQIARMELSRIHKISPDSFEMSYWDLPTTVKSHDRAQVMAVGCLHNEANDILDMFEDAGLNVRALDTHSCAVARACDPMTAPEPRITAILDLGLNSASLSIIHQGVVTDERLVGEGGILSALEAVCRDFELGPETAEHFMTTIGFGIEAQAEKFGQSSFEELTTVLVRYLESLTRELQTPLSYIAHQYPEAGPTRLLLIGDCAVVPGLMERLASTLQMEVVPVAPANLAECSVSMLAKPHNTALTLAIGLAQFVDGQQND